MRYLTLFLLLTGCTTVRSTPTATTQYVAQNVSDAKAYTKAIQTNVSDSAAISDRIDHKAVVIRHWLEQN